MSAHVLWNSFKGMKKSDKLRGLQSIVSLFCKEFNKFINTGSYNNREGNLQSDLYIILCKLDAQWRHVYPD